MKSSPMMIRIAELLIRSAPMIGPTVVTLLGPPPSGSPKRATSAFSRSSKAVPGTTVGAELAAAVGVAVPVAEADALALAVAAAEELGAAVDPGRRSTGEVRIRR